MRTNNALSTDPELPCMHNEKPSMNILSDSLFRQLLSHIERELDYSSPIMGYLYIIKDGNTLSLCDAYNIDPDVAWQCDTVRKGECHCGDTFSSQKITTISYKSAEDTIQCAGICPDSHIIIPVWHNATLVGLANISLPDSARDSVYSDDNYPAVFDLVSGFLGAGISSKQHEKKIDRARLLLEAIDGMALDLDINGKVTDIQSNTNLLDINIGSLIGYRLSDHFVGQDKQEIENVLAKLSAGACKNIRGGYTFRNRHGESQALELSISACLDGDRCDGYIVVCRDIEQQKKSEERFHSLLESAPDTIIIADENGRMVTVNDHCIELLGYEREELVGQYIEMLIPDQLRQAHKGMRDDYSMNPHARLMSTKPDLVAMHKSGRHIPVEIALSPLREGKNNLTIAIIRDITHRKDSESELKRLAFITEHNPGPIIEIDASGRIVYANKSASIFSLDDTLNDVHIHLKEQVEGISKGDEPPEIFSSRDIEVGNRIFQQKIRYAPESDSYFVYSWDTTEAQELSNKLSVKAKTDSLTGLSNRIALIASLKDAINTSNIAAASHTIIYIDLDEFMAISHSLSEEGKNALLKMIGCLLKDNVRQADTLARIKNDQFAVLLTHCPVGRGYQVAEKIKAALCESSFACQDKNFNLTASIGVVEIVKSFDSYSEILASVEAACFAARENGKNSICLYNKKLNMQRIG